MKKFAIGCGVVVLLLGVAGAVASYYIYRQIGSAVAQLSEFSQVPDIERGVRDQRAFTPPASGDLTREQVERLVRVQGRIREHLGTRVAEFESRYKALLDRDQARVRDLPQVIAAYRDLASTWVDAKRQQVQALNDAGFSLDEYRWVRQQTYAALGVPLLDVDVARLIESVQSGESPEALASSTDAAGGQERSDANAPRVEPFRSQLEDNVALAALGL